MLKPLRTTVKADVVMSATHKGIKEIGVYIVLKGAAIHLYA